MQLYSRFKNLYCKERIILEIKNQWRQEHRYRLIITIGLVILVLLFLQSRFFQQYKKQDQSSSDVIKIGIIADAHFYRHSTDNAKTQLLKQLQNFIVVMNDQFHPDFVVELGDKINNVDKATDKFALQEFNKIYRKLNVPRYYVPGNHELYNLTKEEVRSILNIDYEYKAFDVKNFHFIILDSQYNPQNNWDRGKERFGEGYIPPLELKWLENNLLQSQKKNYHIFTSGIR